MSGQPLRRTGDAEVFRQQYLANLGLRAKIDDKNLQEIGRASCRERV